MMPFNLFKSHKPIPHKPLLMVEIPMDTLQALVDAVDKAVAAIATLEADLLHAEAVNANHVVDAAAVKAQADADAALALSVKADVDAKLKAMADKLAGALPKV